MASATSVLVPLEEYLNTTYHPDRDWIDGETRERTLGEMPHATIQGFFIRALGNRFADWNIRVLPEQRVQTSRCHYRIPDVAVLRRDAPFEPIVRTAPLLCIEILSRDDRMSEIQERVDEYLAMGVSTVWVVDPRRRRAYIATSVGSLVLAPEVLTVANTAIAVPLPDVFAELNELEGQTPPQP